MSSAVSFSLDQSEILLSGNGLQVLENVIKRAFGKLNNFFQDESNKILLQKSMNVRFFLSHN